MADIRQRNSHLTPPGLLVKNLEHFLSKRVGDHEILIGPLQVLGVALPVGRAGALQIVVKPLEDVLAIDFNHRRIEGDAEIVEKILGGGHLGQIFKKGHRGHGDGSARSEKEGRTLSRSR